MQARAEFLFKLLSGNEKQFIIPIYQRDYNWTEKECNTLWKDVEYISKAKDKITHFIGAIVYIQEKVFSATDLQKLLLIDGQQRLTTVIILLKALCDVANENNMPSEFSEQIKNSYIFNRYQKDENYFKLVLNKRDQEVFANLLRDINDDILTEKSNILLNYYFFKKKIQNTQLSFEEIFKGISKLIIVDTALEAECDNPQLIFESLNSTGMDLTQADLIRNYILMDLPSDVQKNLYDDYWEKMDKKFSQKPYKEDGQFDFFIRTYLTIKNDGRIPSFGKIYEEFKDYVTSKSLDKSNVLKDMFSYYQNYIKIIDQKDTDYNISSILKNISLLKVSVAYPFILAIYMDYTNGKISKADFIYVLELIENYVFRRSICGIPTNSLNKTFATLYKEINIENIRESLGVTLLTKPSYKRFPRDSEFGEALKVKEIYTSSVEKTKYLLLKIENYDNKEIVDDTNLSIEHIMPQSLNDDWKEDLGNNYKEIYKKYLHTIGNLTLSGYNQEYQNYRFIKKRDMKNGYKKSRLKLNKSLAEWDSYTEQKILERAGQLSSMACQIWYLPTVSQEIIVNSENLDYEDINQDEIIE